jgi:hypothetical protein
MAVPEGSCIEKKKEERLMALLEGKTQKNYNKIIIKPPRKKYKKVKKKLHL